MLTLFIDIHWDELLIKEGTKTESQPSHIFEKDERIFLGEFLTLFTMYTQHFGVIMFGLEWHIEPRS